MKIIEELRKEAEVLVEECSKIETKIVKLFDNGIVPNFSKVEKLYNQRDEKQAQYTKIYELIGKLGNIEE